MTQLLNYADLRDLGIRYSKCQLWRLWTAGKFPKPVKLSAARNVWRADEIDGWIKAKSDARGAA